MYAERQKKSNGWHTCAKSLWVCVKFLWVCVKFLWLCILFVLLCFLELVHLAVSLVHWFITDFLPFVVSSIIPGVGNNVRRGR